MATSEPWAIGGGLPGIESQSATAAALNGDLETLIDFKDTLTTIPIKGVIESAIVFLTLVRDEMVNEDLFVDMAKSCVRTCHVLKIMNEGRDMDDLSGPSKQIEELERTVRHIESVIGEYADCARDLQEDHPRSVIERLMAWREEMLERLRALDGVLKQGGALEVDDIRQRVQGSIDAEPSTPALIITTEVLSKHGSRSDESSLPAPTESSFSDGRLGFVEDATPHVPTDSGNRDSVGESSLPVPPPPGDVGEPSEPSLVLDSGERALQRLISGDIPEGELALVIETIFSSKKAIDMVGPLEKSDAQTFVDVVYEALESLRLGSEIRKKCLKSLYKTCAGHILLPRPLRIELPGIPTGNALCGGGFGDVWKCEYLGQEVAVKVLKKHVASDLRKVTRRFCKESVMWKALRHPNVLPLLGAMMSETQFAMVSKWMPYGNISQFVKAHQDANRFDLLGDAARGLIYMHEQGMVHGDLKGVNVLIDEAKHARLADFGLLTIVSDTTNLVSSTSFTEGGTCRWMGPELFDPEKFGLKEARPTKRSDSYALGMLIYEVLSRRVPLSQHHDYVVVAKILKGERPRRPHGVGGMWFTNEVWGILQRCWEPTPNDRPGIEDVLQCLEEASRSWTPPSPRTMARILNSNTKESTDGSEISSLSQSLSYHPSWKDPEGPPYDVPNRQDPRASLRNRKASESEESAGGPDRTPPTNPRRRSARNNRETPLRSDADLNGSEMDDARAWEGTGEKAFCGDGIVERRRPPDAVWGLFQIKFEKGKAAHTSWFFFFSHDGN